MNGVPHVYAEVDWLEGILRKDQRQFARAEELLVRAVTLYRLAGEETAATYPLMSLGLLCYDRQEYEQALDIFKVMLQIVQPEAEPRLYCYAHHNLTLTLCEVGDYAAAEDSLSAGLQLYREHPDLYTQSRLTWLQGKIAAGLGHLEEAEAAFAAIRQEFVATPTMPPWFPSTSRSSTSDKAEPRSSGSLPKRRTASLRRRMSIARRTRRCFCSGMRCARSG
jgi:hypothetical protein